MEAQDILDEYLLESSHLNSIIKLKQFRNFFPKQNSDELIENVYDALSSQRDELSIQPVENNIRQNFDVPLSKTIKDLEKYQNITVEKNTLREMLTILSDFERSTQGMDQYYDTEIKNVLANIYKLSDKFSEQELQVDNDSLLDKAISYAESLQSRMEKDSVD